VDAIESKFNVDFGNVIKDPINFDHKNRIMKFFNLIVELWRIDILGNETIIRFADSLVEDFYVINQIYITHGKLMCERIPKEVVKHFRLFLQLRDNLMNENKNHRYLKKIKILLDHKKQNFCNVK
jgi:hypothetical protein